MNMSIDFTNIVKVTLKEGIDNTSLNFIRPIRARQVESSISAPLTDAVLSEDNRTSYN